MAVKSQPKICDVAPKIGRLLQDELMEYLIGTP